MADIKKAAKWMEDGKLVRRPTLDESISIGVDGGWIRVFVHGKARPLEQQDCAPFTIDDLLARDWEIFTEEEQAEEEQA